MIIVEGMDNTGKTTLVKSISEEFNLEIVKSMGPERYRKMFDFVDQYLTAAENLKEEGALRDYPFIHDRFPIFSDMIYSLLRTINPFEELEEGRWLYKRLIDIRPVLIHCRPRTDTIISFKDGREQMGGVKPHAKELLARYDNLIFKWTKQMGAGNHTFRYSYEEHSEKQIFDFLREMGYEKNG